jgi:hypothetical protein
MKTIADAFKGMNANPKLGKPLAQCFAACPSSTRTVKLLQAARIAIAR